GEFALFRNAPRAATAIAAEPVTLMVLPANRLDHMVRTNPALANALIRDLVNRMLAAEDRAREAEARADAAQSLAARERVTTACPRRHRGRQGRPHPERRPTRAQTDRLRLRWTRWQRRRSGIAPSASSRVRRRGFGCHGGNGRPRQPTAPPWRRGDHQ